MADNNLTPSQDPNFAAAIGMPGASKDQLIDFLAMLVMSLTQRNDMLQEDFTAVSGEMMQNRLEKYAHIIDDESRPYWSEQIVLNREAATAALDAIANRVQVAKQTPRVIAPQVEQPDPLMNRVIDVERSLSEVDSDTAPISRAAAIRNRAEELRAARPALTFRQSWEQAEKEIE